MIPQQQIMPTIEYPQMFGQQQMMNPFGFGSQFGNFCTNNSKTFISSFMQFMFDYIAKTQNEYAKEIEIDESLKGAWGDPHFNFKDEVGESVNVNHRGIDGETYNVFNADGLDIDAEYKKVGNNTAPQTVGAVRVNAGNQELLLNEGKVILDGIELTVGTIKTLKDGRKVEILENGSVKVLTKDSEGTINIVNKTGHYDIDPEGTLGINIRNDLGGILGLLSVQGLDKTKAEILTKYDTNKNGILDDGDGGLVDKFKTDDIGLYQY